MPPRIHSTEMIAKDSFSVFCCCMVNDAKTASERANIVFCWDGIMENKCFSRKVDSGLVIMWKSKKKKVQMKAFALLTYSLVPFFCAATGAYRAVRAIFVCRVTTRTEARDLFVLFICRYRWQISCRERMVWDAKKSLVHARQRCECVSRAKWIHSIRSLVWQHVKTLPLQRNGVRISIESCYEENIRKCAFCPSFLGFPSILVVRKRLSG